MKELQGDFFDLTHRTIFGLLGQHLFGVPFAPAADVDWKAVLQESRHQAVSYQVFADCRQVTCLDGEVQDALRSLLLRGMMKNMQVHAQHTDLHKLMTAHEIPYVVLKGAASARYYPDPQSRAMGDVDFYVPQAEFDRALEACREAGFEASGLDDRYHVTLRKKGVYLEMHRMPAGVPNGAVGETIKAYLSSIREDAELVSTRLVTCWCPSDFHHGLIMLMHVYHHLITSGIGLRHLSDWAVFANRFRGEEFPLLFREKLKAVGLWKLARLLSLSAVVYLGLPEQSWMRENDGDQELACGLVQDILAGGNFGSKDRQRIYEGLFVFNLEKNSVQKSRISQGFEAMTRITYKKFPFIKKCPILLPAGWVAAFGGYLIRTRERNKKGQNIHTLSAFRKSAPRISLYRQLELYEPERE